MRVLASLVLSCLGSAVHAQSLLVVDAAAGPGSDFDNLTDAVAAAVPGTTLLVRTGSYDEPGLIIDKRISVAADDGAAAVLTGSLNVLGLAADEEVLLSGLTLDVTSPSLTGALNVLACAGAVTVMDCTVVGNEITPNGPGDAAWVIGSSAVTFIRSSFTTRKTISLVTDSSTGMFASDSNVSLYDCVLVGGDGIQGAGDFERPGLPGGAALNVRGPGVSNVFVDGCTLTGGAGGAGSFGFFDPTLCADGGPGGPGLRVNSALGVVTLVDATVLGGAGGASPGGGCVAGTAGPASEVLAGSTSSLTPNGRSLTLTRIVREGETLSQTMTGPEGEAVALFYSVFQGPAILVPSLEGAIHVGTTFLRRVAGILPASGTLDEPLLIPDFDPVLEGIAVHVQAFHVDLVNALVFASAPSPTIILDGAF